MEGPVMFFKIEALQNLDAGTCALIAQILPVFWLVLAVQGGPLGRRYLRPFDNLPFILIILPLAVAEATSLYGAGHGGLTGFLAQAVWTLTFVSVALLATEQVAYLLLGRSEAEE
jgi:hypothetical protein